MSYEEQYFARPTQQEIKANPYSLETKVARRYRWILEHGEPIPAQSRCLDVACGLGQGSWIIAQHAAAVTGIDISQAAIQFAQRTYTDSRVNFICGDILNTSFSQTFTHIFCVHFLEHLPLEHGAALAQKLSAWCAPGGYLYLNLPLEGSLIGRYGRLLERLKKISPHDPTHVSFYHVHMVKSLFEAYGFRLRDIKRNFFPSRMLKKLLRYRPVPDSIRNAFTIEGLFILQRG